MTEYIIEWSGIGARIVELIGSETPCLVVKRLRKERLREPIVRCRDCRFSLAHGNGCCRNQDIYDVEPDGFCAWGERADNFATCKCGEDIETNGRESVTCPSCGRVITE